MKNFLMRGTLGGVLANLVVAFAIVTILAIAYFYVYLPSITNHHETITVPDLHGMKLEDLEAFLKERELRFEVEDSSYHDEFPPLTVLRQFPKAGSTVKENRMIYISLNQVLPPTVPMPDLANPASPSSRVNAEAILKSNGLKRGRVTTSPSPFLHLVMEMRYQGQKIEAGTRIPKGSVIDLVVGDGNGPADFVMFNLVGNQLETAKFKLAGWNLHLGTIQIPEDVDTTGVELYVFKQNPLPGDSVRVGDPVDLIIAPKDYQSEEEEAEENINEGEDADQAAN